MLFSPPVGFAPVVGFALVLPAVGYVLVLPAVGFALSVLLIFSCCWVCSSRGSRTRVASSVIVFLLLTSGFLAVVHVLG